MPLHASNNGVLATSTYVPACLLAKSCQHYFKNESMHIIKQNKFPSISIASILHWPMLREYVTNMILQHFFSTHHPSDMLHAPCILLVSVPYTSDSRYFVMLIFFFPTTLICPVHPSPLLSLLLLKISNIARLL